jgi:hypothetical protein
MKYLFLACVFLVSLGRFELLSSHDNSNPPKPIDLNKMTLDILQVILAK